MKGLDRLDASDILVACGFLICVVGVGLWSLAAACIVAGAGLVLLGLRLESQ